MSQSILCEVNSCKNWEQGNKCNATVVYVGSLNQNQASEMEETGCKTFEPFES